MRILLNRMMLLFIALPCIWPVNLFAEPAIQPVLLPQAATPFNQDILLNPLSQSDVLLYKKIFDLQANGLWKKADQKIKLLDNKILLGHILYQRYMHPTAYHSNFKELAKWMLNYPDHPGAKRIYDLAKKKNGGKTRNLTKPVPVSYLNFPADKPIRNKAVSNTDNDPDVPIEANEETQENSYTPDTVDPTVTLTTSRRSKSDRIDVYKLKIKIKRYLRRHSPEQAEKRLWAFERRNLLTNEEFYTLLGDIANGYFLDNQDIKALALGRISAEQSRATSAQADWVSGLAAWRQEDCAQSAWHFEKVANSPVAGDWLASAGALWAARSYLTCRQPEKVIKLLHKAASYHRTFYGLIAARQLGQKPELNWTAPAFTEDHYDELNDLQSVHRAIALAQIGQIMKADMELSETWRHTLGTRHEALLGLASKLGLAGTQLKIGKIEEQKRMTALDSTLYPVPDTEPVGGFTVDRALMFAIMRQESEFNSWARSNAGARGLMQVMPRTASYISQDRSLRFGSRIKLDDPRYNMALGQQYILSMMGEDFADGNLFKTLTAYNAGPGNLRKWERKVNFHDDPLLFIESIPAHETRNYIERVISNFWIYRMRMKQPTISLDRVAMGDWPIYKSQDDNINKRQKHASKSFP